MSRLFNFWCRNFFFFCLFSVCKHASGWYRRRLEGNIRLIYWSLFSPSSIAAVWWLGYRGTIWQRKRWGEELGLASAPLTSSYLPFRSMTHFIYLIVKHWDLSVVMGQWGNTPGDWQIQLCPPPPHYLLPGSTSGSFYLAQHLLGKGQCCSPDEKLHNSATYGQLIAHLIKKRAIKIGWLMDDSVRINNGLLVRCSDLLQS